MNKNQIDIRLNCIYPDDLDKDKWFKTYNKFLDSKPIDLLNSENLEDIKKLENFIKMCTEHVY